MKELRQKFEQGKCKDAGFWQFGKKLLFYDLKLLGDNFAK
jgi:hypothetical protein